MAGLEIGISGLSAAQNALDIIGNNIANAATEGYHRQNPDLRPKADVFTNGVLVGQGVDMAMIKRNVNYLLETEIMEQESTLEQLTRELDSLKTMESAFGEMTTSALSTTIDNFYSSLHNLSEKPSDVVYQSEVVSTAKTLSAQLQNLGKIVSDLEDNTYNESRNLISDINTYATQIADLNKLIHRAMVKGENPNNMLDERDKIIAEMNELVGVTTYQRDNGVFDVSVGNIPLVTGSFASEVEVGLVVNGSNYDLGLAPKDSGIYDTEITGGQLGGLFSMKNDILRDVADKLDNLAQNIIYSMNDLHVQGVGSHGSFESLQGWTLTTTNLDEMEPPITNGGELFIRVIDASGNAYRDSITVSTSDTISDVITDIEATFPELNAAIVADKLQISVDTSAFPGYKFDFLPGVLSAPNSSTLTGGGGGELPPVVEVLGNYTGTSDETYTFTVTGSADGYIGTGDLRLLVQDSGGGTVANVNIGSGYEIGSHIEIDKGIKIALKANGSEPGYVRVAPAQDFTVEAISDSDTAGILSSTGLNAFFIGTSATSIEVVDAIENDFSLIAVSRNVGGVDNNNVRAMAQLGDTADADMNNLTPKEYYRTLTTDIGQQISLTELKQENSLGIWRSLKQQRDDVSGVDMNDEASKMLVYERMFQGMAKYMNTVAGTLDTLIGIMR